MGRRITILGMGLTGIRKADAIQQFVDGTEVWSLNNAMLEYPDVKFARYFELHAAAYIKRWTWATGADGQPLPIESYYNKLEQLECPIYVGECIPVSRTVKYPFEQVFAHFKTVYFLGSPSLMLALALWEHDSGNTIYELRSWGIDTNDPQHGQQRASWAFWIGKALDRGIKVTGSALDFMNEYEKDAGLRGLREHIRRQTETEERQG